MKEEAKKFFREKLNGCYYVMHRDYPGIIFWYYSKRYVRMKKICKVLGGKQKTDNLDFGGEMIFEQDIKNKNFYIKYETIWLFFVEHFGMKYQEIQDLTKSVLEEHLKNNEYTTMSLSSISELYNGYTTLLEPYADIEKLEVHLKNVGTHNNIY